MGASSEAKRNETKLIIEINRSPGGGELAPKAQKELTHVCGDRVFGWGWGWGLGIPPIQSIHDHRHQRSTTTTIVAKLDHQAARKPAKPKQQRQQQVSVKFHVCTLKEGFEHL